MNKLLVITGGTKGIGRAIVHAFAKEGFDIITCSRNEKELSDLHRVITTDHTVIVQTRKVDVSKPDEVKRFASFINGQDRQVDVLVNNAGFFIPGEIHSEPEGSLESMIETNVYSAYYLTRGLIDKMVKRKHGHIFNICSTASIMPYANGGSYCISKFALLGMTKVLREEMREHNVRVTAVLPGATLTASWEGVELPESRFIKPEDVASAVLNANKMSSNSVVEEILIRPQLGDI